ncbi:DNA internalization-related competence protein ComEC/Rec2, partial [Streptococcus thermophilus]
VTFQPLILIVTAIFSLLFDIFLLHVLTVVFTLSGMVIFCQFNTVFEWMEFFLSWVQSCVVVTFILGIRSLFEFVSIIFVLVLM